jgi:hypothetical protein
LSIVIKGDAIPIVDFLNLKQPMITIEQWEFNRLRIYILTTGTLSFAIIGSTILAIDSTGISFQRVATH